MSYRALRPPPSHKTALSAPLITRYTFFMISNAATEARDYVRGWEKTGQILEELKRAELRKMTEADAAKIFTELDYPLPSPWRQESKPEDNGLVEQQRWFMKAHAHWSRS